VDIQVVSTDSYSHMLTSKAFWEELESPYVLVFQTDTVLLRPPLSTVGLDHKTKYLGAAWCEANPIVKNKVVDHTIGNGGLSLRSSSFMVKCIDSLQVQAAMNDKKELMKRVNMSSVQENEDVFFSTCMATLLDRSELVDAAIKSNAFAVEVPCNGALGDTDGLHATWYYASREKIESLVDKSRNSFVSAGVDTKSCA